MVDIIFLKSCTKCKRWYRHCFPRKAHKVQAMASKRDTQNEIQKWNILGFLDLDTHKLIERKSASLRKHKH
jgi:hypothetical protein